MMIETLNQIEAQALAQLAAVRDGAGLEAWRVAVLGRSAPLAEAMTGLGALSKEERPAAGKRANEVKRALEAAFEQRAASVREHELAAAAEAGAVDVTLPGRPAPQGRLHPATIALRQLYGVFADMGFQIYRSGDVESDEMNFELLNIPKHHPARDMQDTFYTTTPNVVLRTHTSPGQIHAMRANAPAPVRAILPGWCYRFEQITARSEIQFLQIEGIAVGPGIRFSDLKGTLNDLARRLFGNGVRTRFRADYFPFTEPSAEMDVECFVCGGKGCSVCKQSGWLEILGCGMVHPTVLRNGGYDPDLHSGFAFGMGPQRVLMLLHRLTDIRLFLKNDVRFLEQF
jgi:phenylalanyl-tRNA synthetase alpha chain